MDSESRRTFFAVYLNAFHLWGFALDQAILKWLAMATVGEIGGLVYMVVKLTFSR
jgi:hypothetical protein